MNTQMYHNASFCIIFIVLHHIVSYCIISNCIVSQPLTWNNVESTRCNRTPKRNQKYLWRASTCSKTQFRWTLFWSCSTNKQVRPKSQLSDIGDPVVGVHVRFTIGSKMQCSLVGQDSCRWLDRWRELRGYIFFNLMSTLFGSDCHYEWCQSNETSSIQALES